MADASSSSDEEAEMGELMLNEPARSLATAAEWAPVQPHVFSAAFVNTLKSTLGTGLLALPWAFAQAGAYSLPGAIGLCFAVMLWSCYSMLLIATCVELAWPVGGGYGDLAQAALGRVGGAICTANMIVHQVACVAAYLVFIGDNLSDVSGVGAAAFIGGAAPLVLLLVWQRDLKRLGPTSALGLAALGLVLVCVLADGYRLYAERISPPLTASSRLAAPMTVAEHTARRSRAALGHPPPPPPPPSAAAAEPFSALAAFCGISLFTFAGQDTVCSVVISLGIQRHRYPTIIGALAALVYPLTIGFGLVACVGFGPEVKQNVLLSVHSRIATALKLAISASILLTCPVKMFPAAQAIERALLPEESQATYARTAIRTALVGSSVCLALLVPDFEFLVAIIGSFCMSLIAYVLPPAMYLSLSAGERAKAAGHATPLRRLSHALLLGLGLAALVFTTSAVLRAKWGAAAVVNSNGGANGRVLSRMPSASLPLDYYDALRSSEGRSCVGLAPRPAPGCRFTLGGRQTASVVAFGGSMTVGDPLHGVRVPYPVRLAQQLVAHGIVREAYVRNLAEGALHGAAVPALCCDSFLSSEGGGQRLGYNREGTELERTWHANASTAHKVREAPAALLEPVDLVLLEFSVNGIQYVDVLMRRLRARYPGALLLYIDHFKLSQWRELDYGCRGARPCSGCPPETCPDCKGAGEGAISIAACGHVDRFRLAHDFGSAPTCTAELEGWASQVGAGFLSLRSTLAADLARREGVASLGGGAKGGGGGHRASRERYTRMLHLFAGDKLHLTQAGHDAMADAAWRLLQSSPAARHGGHERARPSARAACAAAPAPEQQVQCFFWYRTGRVTAPGLRVEGADLEWQTPRRRRSSARAPKGAARPPPPPPPPPRAAWALRPGLVRAALTSAGEGNGKFAFELREPEATWRDALLSFRFTAAARGSIVRIGFMLHCCMYGVAAVSLDGARAALIHGSHGGFPHHVFQAATIGTVDAGEHTLSLRVVSPGPNGTHQFRLAGLFVAAPLAGLQRDSEYLLTSRRARA